MTCDGGGRGINLRPLEFAVAAPGQPVAPAVAQRPIVILACVIVMVILAGLTKA